jgi:hypothetical protein
VQLPKAAKALEKIKADGIYDVSPLLATTVKGKPIVPHEYEKMLSGATSLVLVRLSSHHFGSKGYQVYTDSHLYSTTHQMQEG